MDKLLKWGLQSALTVSVMLCFCSVHALTDPVDPVKPPLSHEANSAHAETGLDREVDDLLDEPTRLAAFQSIVGQVGAVLQKDPSAVSAGRLPDAQKAITLLQGIKPGWIKEKLYHQLMILRTDADVKRFFEKEFAVVLDEMAPPSNERVLTRKIGKTLKNIYHLIRHYIYHRFFPNKAEGQYSYEEMAAMIVFALPLMEVDQPTQRVIGLQLHAVLQWVTVPSPVEKEIRAIKAYQAYGV
jgi:hypothetical protein